MSRTNIKCPYCGGDGCSRTMFSFIIEKYTTDFWCDNCNEHVTLIHNTAFNDADDSSEETKNA